MKADPEIMGRIRNWLAMAHGGSRHGLHCLVPIGYSLFWLADFRMASTICRTKWNGLARPTVAATLVAGGFELLWPDTEASDFEMKNQLFAMAANITSAATPQVITHASGLAKFKSKEVRNVLLPIASVHQDCNKKSRTSAVGPYLCST
jgi:hypothetical protein